jgi:hypothetical protein
MSILKIKDENGNFIDIPAIKGDAGKSAYEQAVEGGFQGTEEEFIQVLASLSSAMQLQLLELGDEAGEYLEQHIANKSNPHGVTAEQIGSLKFYYSFAALNKALGTSFDVTTPVETIIQAMPNNTGFIGDINAVDKGETSYPNDAAYGTVSIYKIRENRVMTEYVSNIAEGIKGYNRRWVGQYNAGKFGGFKEVFTEAYPPTAEQVGAMPKKVLLDSKDVLSLTKDGWYYSTSSVNVPTETKNGYVRVMTNTNGDYRVVTWQPRDSVTEYTNVLFEGKWLGWAESLVFKNNRINVYNPDETVSPQFTIGRDDNNRASVQYTSSKNLSLRNVCNGKVDALSISNLDLTAKSHLLLLWTRDGNDYVVFGEHNKPSGSYVGNGEESRQINIGGIGNALLIWSDESLVFGGLVTPRGIMCFRAGTFQVNDADRFENGVLYTNGKYVNLNNDGTIYNYQVL